MERKVFLFPLPTTILLEKVTLPFHIFEDRYIDMFEEAVEDGTYVTVVSSDSMGDYQGKIGVAGKPIITKRYEDGRIDVIITGDKKIKLTSAISERPYKIYNSIEEKSNLTFYNEPDFELLAQHFLYKLSSTNKLKFDTQKLNYFLHDPVAITNYLTTLFVGDVIIQEEVLKQETLQDKIDILIDYLAPSIIELGDNLTPIIKAS